MNPDLGRLQPYPFERLRRLLDGAAPAASAPINLSNGEPKHPTPARITRALTEAIAGLAVYPATIGEPALRAAIGGWLERRSRLPALDPARHVLPVNGTREALFAIAQVVVARGDGARVAMPNPFYQIYEGAALLAGAAPLLLAARPETGFAIDYAAVAPADWSRVQLLYVCSPANPTGQVMSLDDWRQLFELSDRHGFVIAADECYSEIYFDDGAAPLGALEAAHRLGRDRYPRLLSFGSLSKRSSVPGLRSGYVAGDAELLAKFLLYRTYHGAAMSPPAQAASIAAWSDEAHVVENRRLYTEKFAHAVPVLSPVLQATRPQAAFYLWLPTPIDDEAFARRLFVEQHVTVLPGSYLGRPVDGRNPGHGFIRIALVDSTPRVTEAAQRIADLARRL